MNLIALLSAIVLVLLNGFFVAAEFALVKVRPMRLKELVDQGKPMAKTAHWLFKRLEESLSACQLGITMASLGLGWIGEPALAHLIEPLLLLVGITSTTVLHTTAFIIAFSTITAFHLVLGEQLPKIFAIRKAEQVALWCAPPLKIFYVMLYPFLAALNGTTIYLLRLLGIRRVSEGDAAHSEEEIRAILDTAHRFGEVTRSEHRLLNAVFEFDDTICRKVMLFRNDVSFVDLEESPETSIAKIQMTKHSRYPLCEGSLDDVVGILHIKDLVGVTTNAAEDFKKMARPPRYVPETMPISKLLQHFQGTRQLMALVVDEHGVTTGIVTLENVLERIVGPVDDEFDVDTPTIVPSGPDTYIVQGSTPISKLRALFDLDLDDTEVDTAAGLIMEQLDHVPTVGDFIQIQGIRAEVLATKDRSARKIRFTVTRKT